PRQSPPPPAAPRPRPRRPARAPLQPAHGGGLRRVDHGPNVHAVTWLAVLAPKCSGIGGRATQPIPTGNDPDKRAQEAESTRLDVGTRGRSPVGMGCKTSQGLRS